MELKISQHVRRTCLSSVTLTVEDTTLIWTPTPANNRKVSVHAKYYRKEIMSPVCLQFIYLGLQTNYISAFNC